MKYRKIYEDLIGPIPVDDKGRTYDIHHIDGDRANNIPSNLIALSIQDHYDIHYKQGDWMACHAIGLRMNLSVDEISDLSKKTQETRINNGTHHFLNSDWQREQSIKSNQKRLVEKTHNWLGHFSNKKMLSQGIHPSQQRIDCEYCGKNVSIGMYKQWHGKRCETYTGSKQTRSSPSKETIEKRSKKLIGNQFAKGRKWFNNGFEERMILPGKEPNNWVLGRLVKEAK